MKLSIIVPVYNMVSDGKLEYCLNSLLNQTIYDYEIIAIDDKSTDDSLAILRRYEKKYAPKFRVIASPENKRQGGAKNLGLEAAVGEWIGFVDSDDWISPDMFSKLLKKAAETHADIVGCDYLRTNELGKTEGITVINNTSEQTGLLDTVKYQKLLLKPGSMVIKIYKSSLFKDNHIRFPEHMFYEDNAIGSFPLLYARRFERVDEPLYFYYQHDSSTVHQISLSKCEDRIKASIIYKNESIQRGFYSQYKDEIDYKIFELGYRNTLYSHLQSTTFPSYKFVVKMRAFLKEYVPNYMNNPYFIQYMDTENQKLTRMHSKSAIFFLLYYQTLRFYRKLRYGK